jgi:hypothetical protein
MRAHVVAGPHLAHQGAWGSAFAAGLRRHGWHVSMGSQPEPCDMLVLWGVRQQGWIEQQRRNGEVCILERGYVGDRFAYTSVSFGGGLNGRGIFRGPFHDGSRWDRHFGNLMQPWRQRQGYALIMGQVPGDQSIKGVNMDAWYRTATEAYRMAGFEPRFRPHPHGNGAAYASLASDLAGAALVVSWNSNSAVDAALAGVPTVAMDRGSMAWDVAGHELGAMPPVPDRTAWANRLAWCQWHADEMRSGDCWAAVGQVVQRNAAETRQEPADGVRAAWVS